MVNRLEKREDGNVNVVRLVPQVEVVNVQRIIDLYNANCEEIDELFAKADDLEQKNEVFKNFLVEEGHIEEDSEDDIDESAED
jgi:hypothetical protein